jgi:zinc protease
VRRAAATFVALLGVLSVGAGTLSAQAIGRAALDSLTYPPLRFTPPVPVVHEVAGVKVLFLEDHTLPLVDVMARFKGGYARFGRGVYAAGMALPELLRFGGTHHLSPDSVDAALESWAIQTSFGGDGESVTSSMNTLTRNLDVALGLWGSMLRDPGFDSAQVEVWRGQALEEVRREADDPGQLAFSAFNRLLYGDHPIGWQLRASDLTPERLSPDVLERLDHRIVCPTHLVLGVSGDVTWKRIEPLLARWLKGWAPCSRPLPRPSIPRIRSEPGIVVVPRDVDQSVIVMAHPTPVHLGRGPEYFAAKVGDQILGGAGFQSRLMSRVRVDSGYAYSVSSVWTTPRRFDGIVGALTRTRSDRTVAVIRLILDVMKGMERDPPRADEVATVVDQLVNGFAFNFDDAAEVVSRRMYYLSEGLPEDWLERYVKGIRGVTAAQVGRVVARNLRPSDMTILVVGDTSRIGMKALRAMGPVTVWHADEEPAPAHIGSVGAPPPATLFSRPPSPSGARRYLR